MFDDTEIKILKGIAIALLCFAVSLLFFVTNWVFAKAEEPIATYTNGSQAIRGECQKHMYYLTWAEQYQESYYTRTNYYAVCWSDPTAKLEGNTLTANDLIYYEWLYNGQTLKQTKINDFTLGGMYGKIDIYSNSTLFSYPQSNNINSPVVKIHEIWFQIAVAVLALGWGIHFVMACINGKS